MRESFTEITRLEPLDIFYVGERHKTYFEYPAHSQEVYELNFVENNRTGRTPNRYIIDYRLGIAARMLLNTKLSVAEIGFSCGFNTLSHFNRLFRESKGCTPSEFRERF